MRVSPDRFPPHCEEAPRVVIFIVEDDPTVCAWCVRFCNNEGWSAECFATAEEFLKRRGNVQDGCLLLDFHLAGAMSGLDLQRELAESGSELPVVGLTGSSSVPLVVGSMQQGAITVLQKPADPRELRGALAGALELSQHRRVRRAHLTTLRNRYGSLTPGEKAVLTRILEGLRNREIAEQLQMGLRTVELRRSQILKKMHAGHFAELVRMAVDLELVPAA